MKKLTFLGMASNSFTSLNTCSFTLEFENKTLLLTDCGPDTPRQIYKAGLKFYDIKTVILTHSHLDHVLGVPYLLFGRNLEILAKSKTEEILLDENKLLTVISTKELFDNILFFFQFLSSRCKTSIYI